MQTFAEIVADSFHSEANVNWKLESTTHAVATFTVRSVLVEVDFEQREHNGPWHVGFKTTRGEMADRTNMTLAFRIFNGVFQAVEEFIGTREPDSMVLIAKDEDLAGVYEAYLRRENGRIEELGYTLQGPHRIDPYTQWTLLRSKPPAWRT